VHSLVRVAGVVVLLAAVGGLCVHYDATFDDNAPYPPTDDLATEYENYVGEETLVFGDVDRVDADAERATVRVDSDEGEFELLVRGFTERVQPGGVVQVYGTLEADYTISATNVAVVNPAGGSKAYKYAVSVVGAVLVLALFFRRWRVDTESLAFELRSGSDAEGDGESDALPDQEVSADG